MRIALMHNINRHNSDEELEFDLPSTIEALSAALAWRHEVRPIECHHNVVEWINELVQFQPGLIFSVAEGFSSAAREAFFPALYEQLGIPFCGSDPTTMLITHNKGLANRIVRGVGVQVPWSVAVSSDQEICFFQDRFSYPLIVKPNSEGSSLGLDKEAIVHSFDALKERIYYLWERFNNVALVQQYIPRGMDVSMTFIEGLGTDGIFGPVEYAYPQGDIFDYQAKSRSYPQSILTFPDTISKEIEAQLHRATRLATKALDVRGYGRADFRVAANGTCYFLELNAQAEIMPQRSDFMAPVFRAGYTYEATVLHIAEYAAMHPRRRPSMAGLYDNDLVKQAADCAELR